jgi:hypothetical protein
MSQSDLNSHLKMMRFMGFRQCPICKECLFAAEGAQFVVGGGIKLCWRCDACGHAFRSNVDSRGRTIRPAAA